MSDKFESLPAASQLAVLPFLAAIEGYLSEQGDVQKLELTVHRTMNRDGSEYLQQLTEYFPLNPSTQGKSGRVIPVDRGIVGAAYQSRKIYRTRFFDDEPALMNAVDLDRSEKDFRAWCAIPFLSADGSIVLVLYARCAIMNFFDDERIRRIVSMANGFCRLYDYLADSPFQNLRNFALESGTPVLGGETVYKAQEAIGLAPPIFKKLTSFNYESSAA